jgi:hypothetical protein
MGLIENGIAWRFAMMEREDRQKLFNVMIDDIGKKDGQIRQLQEQLDSANQTIRSMQGLVIKFMEGRCPCAPPQDFRTVQAWLENLSPRQRFNPQISGLLKGLLKEQIA